MSTKSSADDAELPLEQKIQNAHAQLHALTQARSLHPLSLMCVEVADDMLKELVHDVAATARTQSEPRVECNARVVELLEGCPKETLPGGRHVVTASLNGLLEREVDLMGIARKQGEEAVARLTGGAKDVDIFGNRPRASPDLLICTNCGNQIASNRFAPHLEKCLLGKGRASARHANDAIRASACAER